MYRNVSEIIGYRVKAIDDEFGKVKDFYFDDRHWAIRYVVVDTGGWLTGRQVLISPKALLTHEWLDGILPVKLTKETIENSPPISEDLPVSRQEEMKIAQYFDWPFYWMPLDPFTAEGTRIPPAAVADRESIDQSDADPSLRSVKEIIGYGVQAIDGELGSVHDFIISTHDWSITFLVVDTRKWLPGKRVLIAPKSIKMISWTERRVHISLTSGEIKNSPEFDPNEPVDPQTMVMFSD
jgi:uncharacterized protein YrrD